jgi:SAM-dependent methyltransferase
MSADPFHDSHKNNWDLDAANSARHETHSSWFRTDTADYWRHARMYEAVAAFRHRTDFDWVTIGDGRFGLDSIRIRRLGINSVLPTDIGDGLLKKAKSDALIDRYSVENAENLSFPDKSFDVAFCKESFHHFPRPFLALYEMIRVARHCVILIEPRDYVIDHGPTHTLGPLGLIRGFATWVRARLGLPAGPIALASRYLTGDAPYYEESGNFMYTVSSRELEKVALGLDLPAIAVKGLNDCYIEGGEHELANNESSLFRSMESQIRAADEQSAAGKGSTSMLMAILFVETPDATTRKFLVENEWRLIDLARNPYVRS